MTRESAGVVPEGLLGSDLLKLIKENAKTEER